MGIEAEVQEKDEVGDDDLEAMIDQELAAAPTKDEEKKGGGTGDKEPPQAEDGKLTDEDRTFLAELGLDGEEITAKELTRLKKVHGVYTGKLKTAEDKATWFGNTNKDLSRQIKTLRGDNSKLSLNQPITSEDIKAFREKYKTVIASLPEGTRKLWEDDDYVADKIATQRLMAAQPATAAGTEGEEGAAVEFTEEGKAALEKAHPDYERVYQSHEFGIWVKALPAELRNTYRDKMKTSEGNIEVLSAFKEDYKKAAEAVDKLIIDEIAKVHPNFKEKFNSPAFSVWIKGQSRNERAKLQDTDPKGYIEVLNNFSIYEAAEGMKGMQRQRAKQNNDALRGHGGGAGGGAQEAEEGPSPEDILKGGKAFDDMTERIRKRRTGG